MPINNSVTNYSEYYVNQVLSGLLNDIELSGNITDEEAFFKHLVNPSGSKEHPYYRWVRYREGYSGELVKELIRRSNITHDQYVFDPMSGSGSSLIAAMELGFSAAGTDVIPYSVDLSNSKLQNYTAQSISRIRKFLSEQPKHMLDNQRYIEDNDGLISAQKYFSENNFDSLIDLRRAIEGVKDGIAKKLLWAAWLAILEDCSNRKKDGNGLATRPSKITNVFLRFNEQVKLMLEDIEEHPLDRRVRGSVYLSTATRSSDVLKQFELETKKELGVIIFSPPYANSFDYFESYKLELLCGFYDTKALIQQRQNAIRNYRKGYGFQLVSEYPLVNMLCDEVRLRIPEKEGRTGVADNRSRLVPNLLVGYFEDMGKVLKEFAEIMKPGTQCHIVVDQSAYLGLVIPTDLVLADIGEKLGFEIANIIRCRRAATSGQQLKQYPYLKDVLRESIVTLTKK